MKTAAERFWSKVEKTETCWEWVAAKNSLGYGNFRIGESTICAHRWAYQERHGAVAKDLDLDHLCRNPSCVNPDHLEPVTHRENIRRGYTHGMGAPRRAITHCPQGHEYTEENTARRAGRRHCRECGRAACRAYDARKRAEKLAASV